MSQRGGMDLSRVGKTQAFAAVLTLSVVALWYVRWKPPEKDVVRTCAANWSTRSPRGRPPCISPFSLLMNHVQVRD